MEKDRGNIISRIYKELLEIIKKKLQNLKFLNGQNIWRGMPQKKHYEKFFHLISHGNTNEKPQWEIILHTNWHNYVNKSAGNDVEQVKFSHTRLEKV